MINILKCIKSFKFALHGVYLVFRNENNARVHLLASVISILLGFYLDVNKNECLWIALSITLVWVCESLNSALEILVDLVSPGIHPKAGAVKDIAAGAVLFAALFSLISGGIIFIPKILILFTSP